MDMKEKAGPVMGKTAARTVLMALYVIPLAVIAFIYVQYLYPMFEKSGQEVMGLSLAAMLTFAVVLSILGLALLSKLLRSGSATLSSLDDRLGALLGAAKKFDRTGYVDMLVDSVAKTARDLMDAEAGSLLLYDSDGKLRFEYVEGPVAGLLKGRELKVGEGLTGWAAREGRPLIINDVRSDPRFAGYYDEASGFITKSIMCVPLEFEGRKLGVLEVINRRDGSGFNDQDLKVLVSLSEHAAAAIYRNRMLDESRADFAQVRDMLLAALEKLAPEKKGHAGRVSRYAVELAKGLGLGEKDVRDVFFAALLHDIGFLKFEAAVQRNKEVYRLHPALGADMVKNVSMWRDAAPMIRDHHEWYDGSGYPGGLAGPDISLGGRIIGLAEAFDVMTSAGGYKSHVKGFEEACEEVRSLAGVQFDPQVVDVLLRVFRKDELLDAA